jgi:beta-catenin-like protein 1
MEKDYAKITRLIQLRREYSSRLAPVDQVIAEERSMLDPPEQEDKAGEWLSRRLDAGLFSLQVYSLAAVLPTN